MRHDAGADALEAPVLVVGEGFGARARRDLAAGVRRLELGRGRGSDVGAARIVVEEGVRVAPGGGLGPGVRVRAERVEPAAARSTSRLAMCRTPSNDPGSPAWSPSYAQHSATAAKSSGDTSMLSSATDRRKSVRKIVPGGV